VEYVWGSRLDEDNARSAAEAKPKSRTGGLTRFSTFHMNKILGRCSVERPVFGGRYMRGKQHRDQSRELGKTETVTQNVHRMHKIVDRSSEEMTRMCVCVAIITEPHRGL
jgi:hypothetical protein